MAALGSAQRQGSVNWNQSPALPWRRPAVHVVVALARTWLGRKQSRLGAGIDRQPPIPAHRLLEDQTPSVLATKMVLLAMDGPAYASRPSDGADRWCARLDEWIAGGEQAVKPLLTETAHIGLVIPPGASPCPLKSGFCPG
jgi:hypothetical protein